MQYFDKIQKGSSCIDQTNPLATSEWNPEIFCTYSTYRRKTEGGHRSPSHSLSVGTEQLSLWLHVVTTQI